MTPTRRMFMQQSLAMTLAAGAVAPAGAAKKKAKSPAPVELPPQPSSGKPWLEAGELISKMNWINPPAECPCNPCEMIVD